MASWLSRCFRGLQESAQVPPDSASSSAEVQLEQRPLASRDALSSIGDTKPDALLTYALDLDRCGELEQQDVSSVASLEDARRLIVKLNARLLELEGLLGQNADTVMSLRLPEQESRTGPAGPAKADSKRGKLSMTVHADGPRNTLSFDENKSVPNLFCAYSKQELIEQLSKAEKPAAAVLLQAICEEDLGSAPPALVLDVDPTVGDIIAAAPELVAALKGFDGSRSGGPLNFSHLSSLDRLPAYLRLRLYMMQSSGAKPMLACASASARSLFNVRTDRQLQYVLEGQVQQDAMLGMLLQELLDEMLSAPVHRETNAAGTGPLHCTGDVTGAASSTIVMHSLNHFVHTSNPKVFPFVPVTMRGCGYRKRSGEVVPCIIFEFSPDSNQGAFLEHLQRDYTMMGHISAIITLFTLKGDVLHQNAGSIAYYGYQRRLDMFAAEKRRGSGHGHGRHAGCSGTDLKPWLQNADDVPAWLPHHDERPVLTQLFQLAPPNMLDGMLESMVQGGGWRSILPVPTTLATSSRPLAFPSSLGPRPSDALDAALPGANFLSAAPDSIFTVDGLAGTIPPGKPTSQKGEDLSAHFRPEVFEGSFALNPAASDRITGGDTFDKCKGEGSARARSMRALKAVPEQSLDQERLSLSLPPSTNFAKKQGNVDDGVALSLGHWRAPVNAGGGGGDLPVGATKVASAAGPSLPHSAARVLWSNTPCVQDGTPPSSSEVVRVPRRSTTFTALQCSDRPGVEHSNSSDVLNDAVTNSAVVSGGGGISASFIAGGSNLRLSRIRRRSGLPLGMLDGSPEEALSHSTWGLFGLASLEQKCTHDAGAATETTGDSRMREDQHRLDVRALNSKASAATPLTYLPQRGVTTDAAAKLPGTSGTASGSAGGGLGPVVGMQHARDFPSPTPYSPLHCSQLDQGQQWQFRHSQWKDALHSQSTQLSQPQLPVPAQHAPSLQPMQPQHPATYLLNHRQHTGLSQSSSTATNQSSIPSHNYRRGDTGVVEVQCATESVVHRQRSAAFGDGMTTARSTLNPSTGSLVSPQPSAYQHTDSSLGVCTTFPTIGGGGAQLDAQIRLSPGFMPSRFHRSSGCSPVSTPEPSGGCVGSAAVATAATALKRTSRSELQELLTESLCGATTATTNSRLSALRCDSSTASGTRRRGPMRQSERSNPNLVLPQRVCSSSANSSGLVASSVKSAFSFGPKASAMSATLSSTSTYQRPLVRMLSFLNAPAGGVATSNRAALQSHHGLGQAPAQLRSTGKRAVSVQSIRAVMQSMNSRAVDENGLGGMMSDGRGAGGLQPSELDDSSSAVLLATMATLGTSRNDDPSTTVIPSSVGARQTLPESAGGAEGPHRLGVRASADQQPPFLSGGDTCIHTEDGMARTYHEVTATPFMDPVSKSQVVMVVQTDVTARVLLERRLAEVMEAEHKLLENIFPRHVLEHIAHSTGSTAESGSQFNLRMLSALPNLTKTATDHERVTILFADIVGFTSMCKEVPAKTVMKFLNDLYTRFDTLLDIYGVYKVETIGDCYMVAGGLISKDADGFAAVRKDSTDNLQAWRVVSFAKAMLRDAQKVLLPGTHEPVKLRVGIHTGPVVSGVVGTRMPRFCLFGDTINTASRMESTCPYGRIQVSVATYVLVPGEEWEPTGGVEVKGKGMMETYLLKQQSPNNCTLVTAYLSTPGQPEGAPLPNRASAGIPMADSNNKWMLGTSSGLERGRAGQGRSRGIGNDDGGGGRSSMSEGGKYGVHSRGVIEGAKKASGERNGGGSGDVGKELLCHGVLSSVVGKISVANPHEAVSVERDGCGMIVGNSDRRNSRYGSGSGKVSSFLFNTMC